MLIVDETMVSKNGDQCNLIGTSYQAFNNQPGVQCRQPIGSCLSNQISDILDADMKRLSAGKNPLYIIK